MTSNDVAAAAARLQFASPGRDLERVLRTMKNASIYYVRQPKHWMHCIQENSASHKGIVINAYKSERGKRLTANGTAALAH